MHVIQRKIRYLIKFSRRRRKPPIVSNRKPQLTRPVKLSKPELHENSESLGRWHLQNIRKSNWLVFECEECRMKSNMISVCRKCRWSYGSKKSNTPITRHSIFNQMFMHFSFVHNAILCYMRLNLFLSHNNIKLYDKLHRRRLQLCATEHVRIRFLAKADHVINRKCIINDFMCLVLCLAKVKNRFQAKMRR